MSGGLMILAILLPLAAFFIWLAGQFVRARRAEIRSILAKGVEVEAQVVRSRRRRVDYRFEVSGWPQPIAGSGRMRKGNPLVAGQRIRVRYLPGHPHVSAIVEPPP